MGKVDFHAITTENLFIKVWSFIEEADDEALGMKTRGPDLAQCLEKVSLKKQLIK